MSIIGLIQNEWVLEIALMVLLVAMLFHAVRLERALGVLRRDKAALEEFIRGFNDSTKQAQIGIDRLKDVADGAARQIAKHVDKAERLKGDLEFLSLRADKVADRLEGVIEKNKDREEGPAALLNRVRMAGRDGAVEEGRPPLAADGNRLRSQAERNLLTALKLGR